VLGGIAATALCRPMAAFQLVYVALSVGAMAVLWAIPEHRDWLTRHAPSLQTVATSLFIVSASAHGACSTTDPGRVVDRAGFDDTVRAYPWDGRFYAPGAKTFTDVQLAGGKRGDMEQAPRTRVALGTCVQRMDHVCPWTNCTVGRRNYKYYYAFVVTQALYSALATVTMAVLAAGRKPTANTRWLWFFGLMGASTAVGTCGLCSFHTQLIAHDMTTAEYAKLREGWTAPDGAQLRIADWPYPRGLAANLRRLFRDGL
jgi:hypothetical protein